MMNCLWWIVWIVLIKKIMLNFVCWFWYRLEYDILFFRGMWFVYFLKVDICILFFVDIKWNEKDIN